MDDGCANVCVVGGKDVAMQLIGSSNVEIQRQALQCVSKVMVTNWEFMR
jgi:V-type H+-transporting ATPase subunit H